MDDNKFQKMQDEMSRFEAEISTTLPPARAVIGSNTYQKTQQSLDRGPQPQTQPHGPSPNGPSPNGPMIPPPPPPPMMGPRMPFDGMMNMPHHPSMGMMFGNVPPPPPPPSMLIPQQVQRCRMPGMGMGHPGGFPQMPPGFMIPPAPPKATPAVVSSAPQLYKTKSEKTKKKEAQAALLAKEKEEKAKEAEVKESHTHSDTNTQSNANIQMIHPSPSPAPPAPDPPTHHPPAATSNPNPHHKLSKKEKKNRKIIRTAGGTVWEDLSLLEWQEEDFRLFCGDLGNDVTDELLIRTFSKYSSFSKAKVVRDKRTNKSKGFGFISFKEPADFIKAMKEMNGRYVGSRPIKLRKSTWMARSLDVVRKKEKEKAALISLFTSSAGKP